VKQVGHLMILRILAYNTGKRFLIIYWYSGIIVTVGASDLLQVLQTLEIINRFLIKNFNNVNAYIHHRFMPFRSLGLIKNFIDFILI
jgi:hypothetical protein